MVGAVDFADAERRLAFGPWNTHLTLVIHAVGGIWLVLVRKRVAVSRDLFHRVVTGDVPESAVLLVPRDGAPAAEIGVDLSLTCRARVSWGDPGCCRSRRSRWWREKRHACICSRPGTRECRRRSAATICIA